MIEVDDDTIHVEQDPVAPVLKDVIDVDASWDGKGSLDEHRQQVFAKMKQPGFGDLGKVKPDGE